MAVPTQLSDLSATPASNSPAGSDVVGTTMDDYIRSHAAIIARISAGTDALSAPAIGAATGTSLTLTGGNVVFSTSGKGIDFSATANSTGSMTSELLSDYEEGTWTPVVKDAPTGNAATATTTIGRYTKVGRLVTFTMSLVDVVTAGMTAGNQVYVTGLPFTSANVAGSFAIASCQLSGCTSTTGSVQGAIAPGATYMTMVQNITTGISQFTVAGMTSGSADIYITGHYEVSP